MGKVRIRNRPLAAGNELVALVRVKHENVKLSRAPSSRGSPASANRQLLIEIDDVQTLAQGLWIPSAIRFWSSTRICVSSLQTALFIRRSG